MLYILLSGVPPFWAESETGIFNAILWGHIDFSSDPWPTISSGAKDLVRKMLNSDPKQRLSASQVLNHPWIKEDGEAPDVPLDNAVLNKLKQFRAMNKFKKVALRPIADDLVPNPDPLFSGDDSARWSPDDDFFILFQSSPWEKKKQLGFVRIRRSRSERVFYGFFRS